MNTKNQYTSPQTTVMDITVSHVLMASPGGADPILTPSGNVDPNAGDYIIGG